MVSNTLPGSIDERLLPFKCFLISENHNRNPDSHILARFTLTFLEILTLTSEYFFIKRSHHALPARLSLKHVSLLSLSHNIFTLSKSCCFVTGKHFSTQGKIQVCRSSSSLSVNCVLTPGLLLEYFS